MDKREQARVGGRHPDTAGRALDRMVEIAREKGLDAVSMRDVAKAAGISLAALQYHFPSKDALIVAFVETTLDRCRADIDAIRDASDPATALRDVVRYAVAHTLDARTGDVFSMLEARARHDRATASALERFMRFYLEAMTDVILRRRPDLPPRDGLLAGARVVAMIEGLSSVRAAATALGLGEEDLRDAVAAAADAAAPLAGAGRAGGGAPR